MGVLSINKGLVIVNSGLFLPVRMILQHDYLFEEHSLKPPPTSSNPVSTNIERPPLPKKNWMNWTNSVPFVHSLCWPIEEGMIYNRCNGLQSFIIISNTCLHAFLE